MLAPEDLQKRPGYTEVGVSVIDRDGQEVSGLTRDDFKVALDRQPREIAFFSVDSRAPTNVGILIDTSGSTDPKLPQIRLLASELIKTLPPDSSVFLMAFSNRAYLLEESTKDRSLVIEKLKILHAYGETAMFAAIVAASRHFPDKGSQLNRLVLITDGIDNQSKANESDAIAVVKQKNAKLDIVGVGDPNASIGSSLVLGPFSPSPPAQALDAATLRRLASSTGGSLVIVPPQATEGTCKDALLKLDPGLRATYMLGFIAPSPVDAWNPPWADLHVTVAKPEDAKIHAPRIVALPISQSSPTNESINLNGKFSGEIANLNPVGPRTLEINGDLTQIGDSVHGDWKSSAGAFGTMIGTMAGNRVSLRIDRSRPCEGSFEGIGTITDGGKRVRGSLSGYDCTPVTDFMFDVSRQ